MGVASIATPVMDIHCEVREVRHPTPVGKEHAQPLTRGPEGLQGRQMIADRDTKDAVRLENRGRAKRCRFSHCKKQ